MKAIRILNLVALVLSAHLLCGCFTVAVIDDKSDTNYTREKALEVAKVMENTGGFNLRHVSKVTEHGMFLVQKRLIHRDVLLGISAYKENEFFVSWSVIKRARIRYWTGINVLCLFTCLLFFPSWFYIDFETADGSIVYSYMPWGQLWRNLIPCWVAGSSYGYCEEISKAVLTLSSR